jgi:uroporphyrinogen-III synthase
VAHVIEGRLDAIAITCQIQFRHLYRIAQGLGLEQDLVRTLNERMVVAAVGPTCQAILQMHGVDVDVMPEHPKMGPLIVALMRHLQRHEVAPRPWAGAL